MKNWGYSRGLFLPRFQSYKWQQIRPRGGNKSAFFEFSLRKKKRVQSNLNPPCQLAPLSGSRRKEKHSALSSSFLHEVTTAAAALPWRPSEKFGPPAEGRKSKT
ncbi:hypothetical protein ILYODFUR_021332 [Ilyodon furcidens]|uniref:Uncharacterized protein n=1 Tax=Ilyodon furcidens TaxID=33524 RepID=A0ABV0U781_9TELE